MMDFFQVSDPSRRMVLTQVLDDYCQEHGICKDDNARAVAAGRLGEIARSGMSRAEDLAVILRAMRG